MPSPSQIIPFPERLVRLELPILRLFQSYLPLPFARRMLQLGLSLTHLGSATRRVAVRANSVACEWIIPVNYQPGGVLLYLHGGGFVYGQTPPHLHMGAYLARRLGVRLLMVDYRLAPEQPFPAALDDCLAAYSWLLEQGFQAKNIVLAGDSAGGNLTITTLMALRDRGMPLPAAAACLSPVIDLTEKNSQNPDFKDPLLPPEAMQFYTAAYVGDHDPHDPLISPAFGDFRGLPPLLVHAGEQEILRQDALLLARLAEAAGVDVQVQIFPRMWHVWQINLRLPQARQSLEEIAGFLQAHLVGL